MGACCGVPPNVLLVIAHPKPTSFNHSILAVVKRELEAKGCTVQVRDLYANQFNPLLSESELTSIPKGNIPMDVQIEQKWIKWCNVLILIHPIWWSSMPAILKGYMDRVFSEGFAYKVEGNKPPAGCLSEKQVLILNTHGQAKELYESKFYPAINQTTNPGYELCGMKLINHHYFAGIPYIPKEKREEILKNIEDIIKGYSF